MFTIEDILTCICFCGLGNKLEARKHVVELEDPGYAASVAKVQLRIYYLHNRQWKKVSIIFGLSTFQLNWENLCWEN